MNTIERLTEWCESRGGCVEAYVDCRHFCFNTLNDCNEFVFKCLEAGVAWEGVYARKSGYNNYIKTRKQIWYWWVRIY